MSNINWELLIDYVNGECTDEQIRLVQLWCTQQTENRYLLTYLERLQAKLQQPLKPQDIDEQWLRLLSRMYPVDKTVNKSSSLSAFSLMSLAASLLLFAVATWFYIKPATPNKKVLQVVQTLSNNRKQVVLPDGTQVYMAPNSKLTFNDFDGDRREVKLDGEAFFDVKHMPDKAFIINANDHSSVTVLGTSFNLYTRNHTKLEVKVATGLVGVLTNGHVNYVKAGQQLAYDPDARQAQIKPVIIHDAIALQNSTLVFNKNNAQEIAEKIERWYGIKVKVLPATKKVPLFSGEMKDTGINDLLKGLSYATGIQYRFDNSKTLLLF